MEWGKLYLSKDSTPECIKVLALKFHILSTGPQGKHVV